MSHVIQPGSKQHEGHLKHLELASKKPEKESLRGPTIEEYMARGYKPENYPPQGFDEVPSAGLAKYKADKKLAEEKNLADEKSLADKKSEKDETKKDK